MPITYNINNVPFDGSSPCVKKQITNKEYLRGAVDKSKHKNQISESQHQRTEVEGPLADPKTNSEVKNGTYF
jgi:hypothetical protein